MRLTTTLETISAILETFRGCSQRTHWLIGTDAITGDALRPMLEKFYPDNLETLDDDFKFFVTVPANPDGRPNGAAEKVMLALAKSRMSAKQFSWELRKIGFYRTEKQLEEAEIIELLQDERVRKAKWN